MVRRILKGVIALICGFAVLTAQAAYCNAAETERAQGEQGEAAVMPM